MTQNEALTAEFDRTISTLTGLPDTKLTRPRTIVDTNPLVYEKNATYVIQTHRAKDSGFTIFLTVVDSRGSQRVVIPPKIAAAIYAQRQSLTDRSTPESRKRKAAAQARAKEKRAREARRAAFAARNNGK